MRVKTKLKRLKNPDPQYVSLVTRGANQIPFRIMKKDEGKMSIDLSSLTRIFKGDKKIRPVVTGVVVQKGADFEVVKEQIVKAGYSVDHPVEVENKSDVVMFAQDDTPMEGASLVKMNEDVSLVLKGFEPWSADIQSFNDFLGVEGYYAGINNGTSALKSAFSKVLSQADTADAGKVAVAALLADFNKFVTGLVDAMPPQAFRAADWVMVAKADFQKTHVDNLPTNETIQKSPDIAANCTEPITMTTPTVTVPAPVATPAVVAPGPVVPGIPTHQGSGPIHTPHAPPPVQAPTHPNVVETSPTGAPPPPIVPGTVPQPAPTEVVQKADPALLSAITALTSAVGEMVTIQKSQGVAIAALEGKVVEAVKKSDETERLVKESVIAAPPPGDSPGRETAKKTDEEEYLPGKSANGYFDSAMVPKNHNRR